MPLRFAEKAKDHVDTPLTIRHLLDTAAASAGANTIQYRDRADYSYEEFGVRIGKLASCLRDAHVEEGTVVAVMDWDSHRYLETYFAVPMMGAILQTVNIRLSPDQIRYTLEHSGAEVILVHRDFLALVDGLRDSLPAVKTIILIDDDGGDCPSWCAGEYEALLAQAEPGFAFADFDENATATLFYTTGTTGLPKQVSFSHRQLVLHTLAFAATLGARERVSLRNSDVYMPLTPMFHVHAWGMPYIATMLGLAQVYPGRYEPDVILDLRDQKGVTFSHCVPTVLQMILAAAKGSDTDLVGWKMIIGGSAPSNDLTTEARGAGIDIAVGYGMSETCPVISLGAEGDEPADALRSGRPIPLVSVKLVGNSDRSVPHDDSSEGELVLRAPWLTQSYPGNAEESDKLWEGGWLHTQDLATIDGKGSIQIRDRIKDVIKSGGEWISSLALEDLIREVDGVSEVAVVGLPHPKWQERPVAFVVPSAGAEPTADDVNRHLAGYVDRGTLSKFAMVDEIRLVRELPKTSVGKIDKKALRAPASCAG